MPWRRERQPTPVFLPGKSHGQQSLAGYSPWGRKETDVTERLTLSHACNMQVCIHNCGSDCFPARNFFTVNVNEPFIRQLQEVVNILLLFTLR